MPELARQAMMDRGVFLSTVTASARERRLARLVVLISFGFFLLAVPFAQVKLTEVWAFIPSYQAALLVNDLITATLLFAQFHILRSPQLLVLASGYFFSAVLAVVHALSFPRLFAPQGLIGAGPQTTAWLYMIWHTGFPFAVIAYSVLRDAARVAKPMRAITAACIITIAVGCGAAILTTTGHALLPTIMRADGYTPLLPVVIGIVWSFSLAALLVLWKRRPHSVLDLWLMVVMWAWLFDIGLSAMLNAGRFDLGFYAGRAFGLMAASLVLLVLLIETGLLYSRLARSFAAERDDRNRQLQEVRSELIHVSRLAELGQMVAALAHEVNQPLAAAGNFARASRRLMKGGDLTKADSAVEKAVDQITRASQVIQRLRQFLKKADGQRHTEDVRGTIEEAVSLALPAADRDKVHLEMIFAPDLPPVVIDKVQVQQVLLNLIRNAAEAMHASRRRALVIRTMASADGKVEVSVADSGPGLTPEVRARLFQPFVTTKAAGMGVGLSICRGIVEAHGGRMWLVDTPGGGADFHFTLPITHIAEEARA